MKKLLLFCAIALLGLAACAQPQPEAQPEPAAEPMEEHLADETPMDEPTADEIEEPMDDEPTEESMPEVGTMEEENGTVTMKAQGEGVDVEIKAGLQVEARCGSRECFEEQFANCEPGQAIYATQELGLATGYDIQGPADNGCTVRVLSLAHPLPDMVDTEMTCVYDNSKPFIKAVEEAQQNYLEACEGEAKDTFFTLMEDMQ